MARIVRIDPGEDQLHIQQLDQLVIDPGHAGYEHIVAEGGGGRFDIAPVALGDLVDAPYQKAHQGTAAVGNDDEAVGHLLLADGAIAHRHRHVDHRNGGAAHIGSPQHGRVRVRHCRQLGVGHYLLHLEGTDGKGLFG